MLSTTYSDVVLIDNGPLLTVLHSKIRASRALRRALHYFESVNAEFRSHFSLRFTRSHEPASLTGRKLFFFVSKIGRGREVDWRRNGAENGIPYKVREIDSLRSACLFHALQLFFVHAHSRKGRCEHCVCSLAFVGHVVKEYALLWSASRVRSILRCAFVYIDTLNRLCPCG